jgi:hypothetical protein
MYTVSVPLSALIQIRKEEERLERKKEGKRKKRKRN